MSNQMPIYSHVVQKSNRERAKTKNGTREKTSAGRNEFDPLNYNHGGQFHLLNSPTDKLEKEKKERSRVKEEPRVRRIQKVDPNEGKVEAYLRQNQMSIRQQQHRHSAVRQAEHRVNLRSLPLNEVTSSSRQDRTPTERHRGFPERERDGNKEHKRERNKDRDREVDADGSPLSPLAPRGVRKSSSSQRVAPCIAADSRRFFGREWILQKLAHSLEQRSPNRSSGLLILGDAGSGKTALCQELSSPGQGAQARQQRALNRRLLARHFLQSNRESSLTPGEFIRSLAMQILSHSTQHKLRADRESGGQENEMERRNSIEEGLVRRFKDLEADDGEDSCKPLLGDSEDQRSDDEESATAAAQPEERRTRTIDRMRDDEEAVDVMPVDDDEVPRVLPRTTKPTNPFLHEEEKKDEGGHYENHENLFLRNVSRQSGRLPRQSSEPEHKTDSASENERSKTDSPCKSRIPVASFKYPNKSEVSLESSPKKPTEEELPEYTNLLKDAPINEIEVLLEKKRSEESKEPPPIPTLPISPRTYVANAYYDKLLSEPEMQMALLPQALEKDPDECFKRALLYPLLSIEPKQSLFLLVDAVDEGCNGNTKSEKLDSTQPSPSICVLLSRHQHLLPGWLLLVCTAGKQARLAAPLHGFRKITLDELQRAHVSADIQRYVLARLDAEPRLRARVSSDSAAAAAAAAALDHLRIKSDGCLLYLEKVLDGVADGFIALREIREIPGTLNGLYLWLCQRLFHGRRFAKVRLLLDVMLAARCGVTEEMLYKCLLTKEYSVTREDFNRRLHLLRRILVMDRSTRHVSIFHHSFASWLTDVKHCTRRYLCAPSDGHAALAMYYTLDAARLSALEVHNYVLHMTHLEQHLASLKKAKSSPQQDDPLPLHTLLLLWVLDSGCDVESALRRETEVATENIATQTDIKEEKDGETESVGNASTAVLEHSPISSLLRGLQLSDSDARWPKDARLLRALTQLTSVGGVVALQSESTDQPTEDKQEEVSTKEEEEQVEEENLDPTMVHELATRGDDDTLMALIKRHPHLIESTDGTGGTALHAAARSGRAGAAGALLGAGAKPDAADSDGWSPLRAAAWAGHTEVVEVLLDHGCSVDCVDTDQRTALRAAAWSGHEAVVARLLGAGAAPDHPDKEGRTPLIAAAYMGHAEIVRALLEAGAEIDKPDDDGRTALSVASLCGAGAGVTALLLERGADVNRADRDGATPLLVAAFEGHTDICELLLEASADIEATDASGRAALWAAAAAGHAPAVRLLLFWGATVDHMDGEGRTVLTIAAAQGNVEVVRQLLDRGLDEHHRDNSGWTPLHYAAFEGHIEVCTALLEAGAIIDTADNEGKTALMLAAQEGHAALCAALAGAGARHAARAHDGKTAIRLAALEGHFETVRVLYSLGADVNALDADKRSILYVLALDDRLSMARYLLCACDADVDTRDAEGRTPLHVSAWQGHDEMVNLLIKVGGADVDGRDHSARTALHAAAWRGRAGVLGSLLRRGAAAGAVCAQGATPLGIAAQEGHEECVLLLLQFGADPLQADHCGRTPAKVAWRAGHTNICRLLELRAAAPALLPPAAPAPPAPALAPSAPRADTAERGLTNSPDWRRLSAGSTRGSSHSASSRQLDDEQNRTNMSLSFAQQVARRGRRERERDNVIPEHKVVEQDSKLRSYMANEKDADIVSYTPARAIPRGGDTSPLYASPPHSPPPAHRAVPTAAVPEPHFSRDTHMRIILGREGKPVDKSETSLRGGSYGRFVGSLKRAHGRIFKKHPKNKRNGIVTNPAMRLVANVRNGLDNAAANIRRTGVALAASASSSNPAVKTNAFQWRKETPL